MSIFEDLQKISSMITAEEDWPAKKKRLERSKNHKIKTWWQLEDKLTKEGLLNDDLKLSYFCPVYFAGQQMVRALLDLSDEHSGEKLLFALPSISDKKRVEFGIKQMKLIGIDDPEQYLVTKDGKKNLLCYSSLPGIEGVAGPNQPEYVAYEAVQLGAFSIVPERWLNAGLPFNESYKFPGEEGYSPYWRIPPFEEFKKVRPDLAKGWKETEDGWIKKNFKGM